MPQQLVMEPKTTMRDDLDRVRKATQDLHQAITGVLSKRAEATKADAEDLVRQAKESAELAVATIRAHYDAAEPQIRQHLEQAAVKLEAARKQAQESLQASGQASREFLTNALAEARASARKVSEAIAAKRSKATADQTSSTPAS